MCPGEASTRSPTPSESAGLPQGLAGSRLWEVDRGLLEAVTTHPGLSGGHESEWMRERLNEWRHSVWGQKHQLCPHILSTSPAVQGPHIS